MPPDHTELSLQDEKEVRDTRGSFVGVFLGWLLFGWVFGWHWGLLGWWGGGSRCYAQMIRTWVLVGLFIGFRWPLPQWSHHCSDNSTMSRDCLFHDQDTRYTTFYLIHICILVFVFITYFVELIFLHAWTSSVLRHRSSQYMYFCCTKLPFTLTFALTFLIAICIEAIWANINWTIG
eukprot:TRINITY_DN8267_c0_g1_i1.p1 TRINITY_DN8267_c0_g1~~TRINITY_DN8267_c0_g1_i1.p1  ORF type:complete len:177 (+),score=55.36 TRINITY_DN8267_c0_g1_i1:138-668(+)